MKTSNARHEKRPWRHALNFWWKASGRSFHYPAEDREFQYQLDSIHNRLVLENQRHA